MSSSTSPDPWQSQASTSDDSREPDPDDADTGPLPVSSPPVPAEERWHAGHGTWADKFDAPLTVNPRPVRRHERKPIVFLSAVSLLIVVVVGGLIYWLVRPTSDSQSASPSPAPTTTPRPETDRLLRLVPTGYSADACKPASEPKDALAQVDCARNTDPGGPVTATYTLVENKAALAAAFNEIVLASTRVNCPGNIQSPGPWRRNATPDKVSGVLFCGVQDGRPTVAWSDESRLVVGKAQSGQEGPTFDELYAWWSSHS
jgi:serine/threonine kinase PknH